MSLVIDLSLNFDSFRVEC